MVIRGFPEFWGKKKFSKKFKKLGSKGKDLPDGELNPGLPRDRRGYSPLYYRGLDNRITSVLMLNLNFSESEH